MTITRATPFPASSRPDATLIAGVPGPNPMEFKGAYFHQFWRDRLEQFKKSENKCHHPISNITFLNQTATTAHVNVVGLLTDAMGSKVLSAESSLNYEGGLVKGGGVWKIER